MGSEEHLKSAHRRPKCQRPQTSEDEYINLMRQAVDTNVLAELEEIEIEF